MVNFCAFWSVLTLSSPFSSLFHIDIQFRMYTTDDPKNTPFTLKTITSNTFDITKNFMVLTHGWMAGSDVSWIHKTIEAFQSYPNTVVITAGYEEAMSCKLYVGSVFNIGQVGDRVGELLVAMNKSGIPLSNIEMAGHSLGAHVAGRAGQLVEEQTGFQVERIFGLDPAGPFVPQFRINKNVRLKVGDAKKVIVIHTSLLGTSKAIGDVDFFPNGGKLQHKCGQLHESDHVVATYYFYCSVNNNCTNIGHKCQSYSLYNDNQCADGDIAQMGYNVESDAEGSYYLNVVCA